MRLGEKKKKKDYFLSMLILSLQPGMSCCLPPSCCNIECKLHAEGMGGFGGQGLVRGSRESQCEVVKLDLLCKLL